MKIQCKSYAKKETNLKQLLQVDPSCLNSCYSSLRNNSSGSSER